MSIGAISTSQTATQASFFDRRRPDPGKIAEQAFTKLDTGNKGFLDKTDLQSAFAQIGKTGANQDDASQVDDVIKSLDSSGDGKITKQEFTDGLKRIAEQLDQQLNAQRFAARGELAQQAFTQIDSQGKGYLEQQDLQNAIDQVSTEAKANGAPEFKLASAEDLLKALDKDGDSKITQQEFSDGLQQASQNLAGAAQGGPPVGQAKPAGGPPAGGPPPAGGAGGANSAGGVSGAGTSSSKNYDPADANKDGTVSEQELSAYQKTNAYLSKHPEAQAKSVEQRVAFNILQLAHAYGQAGAEGGAVDVNA